ncbi:hypothetical protein GCM10028784_27200 [Myceligenerans cantabricum]
MSVPAHGPAPRLEAWGGTAAAELTAAHAAAAAALERVVRPLGGPASPPVLVEGGPYPGTWLESTATIGAELLGRFAPGVARDTMLLLARHARADGLLPYKVTDDGPAHRQIQRVTPLARSVWDLYRRTADTAFLRTMYRAMADDDAWVARHRDTRGSGGVEAFCTFDTGHDASPRFWHVPDTTPGGDPAAYDPASPRLPFVAPDLTANQYANRVYLARAAEELGHDPARWRAAARDSAAALEALWDDEAGCWFDHDATGSPVRLVSDVLLRVLACEAGDGALFREALRRYLLHDRHFFAAVPLTSVSLSDPRFDHDAGRNSWGGPTNLLTLVRTPAAFEHHGHVTELSWILRPALAAVARSGRFPQTLDPWTGAAGYTDDYSPAVLFVLDAVERLCGLLVRPDGSVWCTGTLPDGVDEVRYTRTVGGTEWTQTVRHDGVVVTTGDGVTVRFPRGWRVALDRSGDPVAVTGMLAHPVTGAVVHRDGLAPTGNLTLAGNEQISLTGTAPAPLRSPGIVVPGC